MMWHISQKSITFFSLFTGICLLLCAATGCKDEASQEKPQVVVKRIEQAPEETAPKEKPEPPKETASSTPAPAEKAPVTQTAPQPETVDGEPAPEPEKEAETPEESTAETEPADQAETAEATTTEPAAPMDQEAASEPVSLMNSLADASPRYDPTGKIDPFTALFSEESGETSEDTEPQRPLTPLEKIDISQLKLVAVLQAESGNKAMVEDATGKGYILVPGTFIGINSGKVAEILKDRVIVEEKGKDLLGRVRSDMRELKLQKPFGED